MVEHSEVCAKGRVLDWLPLFSRFCSANATSCDCLEFGTAVVSAVDVDRDLTLSGVSGCGG